MGLILIGTLLASRAAASSGETAVAAALERAVALARAGAAEALAPCLACTTGVPGPGTLHVRPCAIPADSTRTRAVASSLRAAFGEDAPFVIDWIRWSEEEGTPAVRLQVKVRRTAPPDLVELRFLASGDSLLLADAGSERLTAPEIPAPASPREAAERTMELLFRLSAGGRTGEAAAQVACLDATRRCDPDDPADRARVEGLLERLSAFQRRVGPTGWGFTGYRANENREGARHVLEIGYLDDRSPDGRGVAYAAFIEIGAGVALGELLDWPE